MLLFELAYCCRLFGEAVGDDAASGRFREATGGVVDLGDDAHRGLLLAPDRPALRRLRRKAMYAIRPQALLPWDDGRP